MERERKGESGKEKHPNNGLPAGLKQQTRGILESSHQDLSIDANFVVVSLNLWELWPFWYFLTFRAKHPDHRPKTEKSGCFKNPYIKTFLLMPIWVVYLQRCGSYGLSKVFWQLGQKTPTTGLKRINPDVLESLHQDLSIDANLSGLPSKMWELWPFKGPHDEKSGFFVRRKKKEKKGEWEQCCCWPALFLRQILEMHKGQKSKFVLYELTKVKMMSIFE